MLNFKKYKIKNIAFLQAVIVIYTIATVMAKFAAQHTFFSKFFFVFYALEILILGVYALLWQQAIKHFDLSVAYANRAVAILWSLVWASCFFGEAITIKNILGVLIVALGIIIVNLDE